MTIVCWVIFGVAVIAIWPIAVSIMENADWKGKIIVVVIACVLTAVLLFGGQWYFNNTASGRRALLDQKSNIANGLDRTVTVYTADGEVIAQYKGKIDIESNEGGYIKFDFAGKRYIYYNCFVESIADIK